MPAPVFKRGGVKEVVGKKQARQTEIALSTDAKSWALKLFQYLAVINNFKNTFKDATPTGFFLMKNSLEWIS